tara:strand:+ start:272 stop:616 length:345 start_codon:yes stop_codon:yes gene_type:complete
MTSLRDYKDNNDFEDIVSAFHLKFVDTVIEDMGKSVNVGRSANSIRQYLNGIYRNILKDINERSEVRIEDDPIFARAALNVENYTHRSKTIHPNVTARSKSRKLRRSKRLAAKM